MNETKEIRFKPTIFAAEQRLILDPEFIEFYKSANDNEPVRFSKFEIDAFRFGVKWIRGYSATFGRVNCIEIKNATGQLIKIRLTSVYKINLQKINKKYGQIIHSLVNNYIPDMVNQYLKLFNYKQPFSILNVHFDQEGLTLNDQHKIEWRNVDVKSYTRYIAISTKTKSDIYQGFNYWDEWNTLVLYNVVRAILKNKNLIKD